MSGHFAGWDQHTLERALEELTSGLPKSELAELTTRVRASDLESLELALAQVNLAGLGVLETPTADVMRRLAADARAHIRLPDAPVLHAERPVVVHEPRRAWRSISGWLVAASLLVALAVYGWTARTPDPASRRERLLARAADLVRAPWSPTQDPLAGNLSGDVIWSSKLQEGYMHFSSLAPNDRKRHQYQLWIFDSTRAEWQAKPVDGGVFDVGPGQDVVVPIVAKLEVRKAALFGVTLEDPGGVVVSQREHLLATATP